MKYIFGSFILIDNSLLWFFMQIMPEQTSGKSNLEAYLISAIAALVATVSALFFYTKNLNKLLKTTADSHARDIQEITTKHLEQLREIYTTHLTDYKETTNKNTEAFTLTASASRDVADSTKENTRALNDLRLWLADRIKPAS